MMDNRRVWDAVIVGAGPAASAAAITAMQKGLSCLILEQSRFPRHRPGETLHPGIEPLLRQLGVWEAVEVQGFLRHRGVAIQSAHGLRFEAFGSDERGEWLGLQAPRAQIDAVLLDRAKALGATVMMPCRAQRVVREGDRIIGLQTDTGYRRTRFLIDATGARHWLATVMGIDIRRASPRLVARYGYVEGDLTAVREHPLLLQDDMGWTWIARVRDRLTHWTRLNVLTDHAPGDARRMLSGMEAPLPRLLSGLPRVERSRGADVTWRYVSQPAGPGFFIVGDAVTVLDPASSHGVLRAVMSGIHAGYLMARILAEPAIAEIAAAQYARWVHRWFSRDVAELSRWYDEAFPGWRMHRGAGASASPGAERCEDRASRSVGHPLAATV